MPCALTALQHCTCMPAAAARHLRLSRKPSDRVGAHGLRHLQGQSKAGANHSPSLGAVVMRAARPSASAPLPPSPVSWPGLHAWQSPSRFARRPAPFSSSGELLPAPPRVCGCFWRADGGAPPPAAAAGEELPAVAAAAHGKRAQGAVEAAVEAAVVAAEVAAGSGSRDRRPP